MRPAPSVTEQTRRRALVTLLTIYDLHTAPIARLGPAVWWQHHPGLAALKLGLEEGSSPT